MAGITLAQATAKLAEWMAADTAVAGGQEYSINGRSLRRSDAQEIRNNIKFWNDQVLQLDQAALSGVRRGPRVRYIRADE